MIYDSLVGRVLGNRYEILEIIGTGGMATVYKARCKLLNRMVAVKVLKESLKDDPDIVKKFNTESQAAASLSHHNIVSIYDVGDDDGINYIVMEYVDGITLKEYINRKKKLDWHEACTFASQIASALEHAHSKNIIHRDIKPHNILMTKDLNLKVADFGIARAVSSETVVVGAGNAIGSVHYISPEQARGGYTDARSDIYSLGVVLYEMLTGELPFNGENAVSVAIMHINNEPKNILEVNPNIPASVAHIVMKAISKEQHLRYQKAADMIVDLKAALSMASVKNADNNGETQRISVPKKEVDGEKDMSNINGRKNRKNKKVKTLDEKKQDKLAAFLIGGSVLVVLIIAISTFFIMHGGAREVQVPELLNMTLEEAKKVIENTEFTLDENVESEVSETVEEGKIVEQDPGANQSVKKNTVIKVTISLGKTGGTIPVPDVAEIDYKDAIKKLNEQKLGYKIVDEETDEYVANTVVRQSPQKDTKLNEGDIVTLYVAKVKDENELIQVPDVLGLTREKAESLIKSSGFKVGNVSKDFSDAEVDTIASQSPNAKSESPKGSYINIVISKGIESTPEPTTEPTTAPTKAPEKTSAPTTQPETTVKTLTIPLTDNGKATVHVKVIANGKNIHDQEHNISEGAVYIPVSSSKDAAVQVYFDGVLVEDRVIKF